MTAVKMDERSHYFVDRLQELLDPRNEFESSEFFFVGGLLELTRQYSSMPPGVKELSEKGLRDSITSLLDKRGTLIEFRNQIPNKEIKEPLHRMFLVHQLKSEKYILDLYKSLMQSTTFLGILYAINHVVKRGLVDANEEKTYHFLDDLIYLLIEYLKQRGHTPQNLHRFIYTKRQQVESGELYENVYRYFVSLASQKQENMDTQECLIVIFCDPKLLPFMKNFTFRLMENYQVDGRIKKHLVENQNENENQMELSFTFFVYKIDDGYVDRLLKTMLSKYDALVERSHHHSLFIEISIVTSDHRFPVKRDAKQATKLKVKHFDLLWSNADFIRIDHTIYDELFRLHDWISMQSKTTEKQLSFNALWSIMEFMLVDSVHEDKLESIYRNFMPYMGLFYFRKVLKTYFQKLVRMHGTEYLKTLNELVSWIKTKVQSELQEEHTFADAFCYFLFHKQFRENWWDGIDFKYASKSYIQLQTDRIHKDLNSPTIALARYELIVKNDLKQMYRLRNMLTHSGTNDDTILTNTYHRLKYYVETLLNAVGFAWNANGVEKSLSFVDLNDLKRVDWSLYKEMCGKIGKLANTDPKNALLLVNYVGLTPIPPNRFSFLSSIGKE